MRRSQQAFSAPSKQTQSSNAKDELRPTASINASSTTLIPSSKLLASKPRDCTLKREQNSCYEHDNGLGHCTHRRAGEIASERGVIGSNARGAVTPRGAVLGDAGTVSLALSTHLPSPGERQAYSRRLHL